MLERLIEGDRRLSARRPLADAVLAALCLAAAGFALLHDSGRPLFNPDSQGYLDFDAFRPYGYPALLLAIRTLSGAVEPVVGVQIAGLYASLFVLARAFGRFTGSLALGAGLVVLTAINLGLLNTVYSIQVEAVAAALLMLAFAAFLDFLRTGRDRCLLAYGAFIALSLTVRPIALVLIPVSVLHIVLFWRPTFHRHRRAAAGTLALMVIGLVSVAVFNRCYHGYFGLNGNAGVGLYGKAMFLDLAGPGDPDVAGDPAIRAPVAEVAGVLAQVGDFHSYLVLLQRYNVYLRFYRVFPHLAGSRGLSGQRQLDQYTLSRSLAVLAADPGGTLRAVLEQLYALVINPNLMTRAEAGRFQATVAALAPLPLPNDQIDFGALPELHGDLVVIGFRIFNLTALAAGLAMLGLALARLVRGQAPPAGLQAASLAILTIAATDAATALGDVTVARYTYPLWPVLVLTALLAAAGILDRWRAASTTAAGSGGGMAGLGRP